MKIGDKVRFKQFKAWCTSPHVYPAPGKPQEFGFVEAINGSYIYVRPRWKKDIFELYDCELSVQHT